jgi:hypothetical protein
MWLRIRTDSSLVRSLSVFLSLLVFVCCGCSGLGFTSQPSDQTVYAVQTATFTAVMSGGAQVKYQWQKNGIDIPGATSSTYTTPRTSLKDNGAQFLAVATHNGATWKSNPATLTVIAGIDVPTYDYENMRIGQNTSEKILTPALVGSSAFGPVGSFKADGAVDSQPLYLSNVTIPNIGPRNVLYVATEHGTVSAFDADSANGDTSAPLWSVSTVLPGESSSDSRNCDLLTPEIGVTASPVIDRTRGAIYLIAATMDAKGNYYHRLHALDITTGRELFGGPTTVSATYPGTGADGSNGTLTFGPAQLFERASLLELNGTIYTTWSSNCDTPPYTSWVIAYSADTLQQTGVTNMVPNGGDGGIWMSGAAPAVDASGNIYIIIGNGDFGTTLNPAGFPANGNFGNCFVKISPSPQFALLDYFTPLSTVSESQSDRDFGSGGPLLLPDMEDSSGKTRHLAVAVGKDSNIYVIDRDNMGKFNSGKNNIYQEIDGQLSSGMWAKPSYFNGTVYLGAINDAIKAFPIQQAKLAQVPSSQSKHIYPYPGVVPTISANGTSNAILWAEENVNNGETSLLRALDATNLATELYNGTAYQATSGQTTSHKFVVPVVANGKVYVATANGVAVFGQLP